tara:strand:- start:565 stop:732 length:168 start_codon:yes stop_codon:yes gene_type:complete
MIKKEWLWQEDEQHLDETINFVKKGFIKGLWKHRRADAEHIINKLYEFKKEQKNN